MISRPHLTYTEDQYEAKNREIHGKYSAGIQLTQDEQYLLCDCLRFSELRKFPGCADEYFQRIFLQLNPVFPVEHVEFDNQDIANYQREIQRWEQQILINNHQDELFHVIAKETREEIKLFKKDYRFDLEPDLNVYFKRKSRIIEWSKYRAIIIKRIINQGFSNGNYTLHLNGQEIIFNYFSIVHILTRHYGMTMKPFNPDKSFFHEEFYHEDLYIRIDEIFKRIDHSGMYSGQSVKNINFEYKHITYKIYCEDVHIQRKPPSTILRLNTFFPITNQRMLDKLATSYEKRKIDDELFIFLEK